MSSILRTDWSRIDVITDEAIDTSDILPFCDWFFLEAKWSMLSSLSIVAIRINSETLAWFQLKG